MLVSHFSHCQGVFIMLSAFFSRRASYVIATFTTILLVAACSGGGSSSSGGGAGSFGKASIAGSVNSGVAYYQPGSGSLIARAVEFTIPSAYADGVVTTVCLTDRSGNPIAEIDCKTTGGDGQFRFDGLDSSGTYYIKVGDRVTSAPVSVGSRDKQEFQLSNGMVVEIKVEGQNTISISGEVENSEDSESEDSEERTES